MVNGRPAALVAKASWTSRIPRVNPHKLGSSLLSNLFTTPLGDWHSLQLEGHDGWWRCWRSTEFVLWVNADSPSKTVALSWWTAMKACPARPVQDGRQRAPSRKTRSSRWLLEKAIRATPRSPTPHGGAAARSRSSWLARACSTWSVNNWIAVAQWRAGKVRPRLHPSPLRSHPVWGPSLEQRVECVANRHRGELRHSFVLACSSMVSI